MDVNGGLKMITNKQELYNYLITELKDLYNEIDSTPFSKEGQEVLNFYEELKIKIESLRTGESSWISIRNNGTKYTITYYKNGVSCWCENEITEESASSYGFELPKEKDTIFNYFYKE